MKKASKKDSNSDIAKDKHSHGKFRSKGKDSKRTGDSSEEETTVVKKKSRYGQTNASADQLLIRNGETGDIGDAQKKQMDEDLEERDAFVARLLEKEESKTRKAEQQVILISVLGFLI